jgi:UDP-N-acetyl-D-mannosaminuronate dehydrogenase
VALQCNPSFGRDAVAIGGCGHAGLPLAVAFAGRGVRV